MLVYGPDKSSVTLLETVTILSCMDVTAICFLRCEKEPDSSSTEADPEFLRGGL